MRIFLLLFFTLTYFSSFSQEQIIYENQKRESYLLRYYASGDASQQTINYMTGRVASALNRHQSSYQVGFSHDYRITITQNKASIMIYVDFDNFAISPVNYRRFNIADVLYSSFISFNGRLIGKNNQILSEYSINPVALTLNNSFTFSYIDSSMSRDYRFEITSIQFIYDDNNRKNLDQRLSAIDNYYIADSKIKDAMNDMNRIDPMNPDLVEENFLFMSAIKDFVLETESLNLNQLLNLSVNDPEKHLLKMAELRTRFDDVYNKLVYTQNFRHEIYYNAGVLEMDNQNFDIARDMFKRSISSNPRFAPALLRLAMLDLHDGQYAMAAEKITDIIFHMTPDPQTLEKSFEVAYAINEIYAAEIYRFFKESRYHDVIRLFDEAFYFCNSLPQIPCKEEIFNLKTDARKAIYRDFIIKGKEALRLTKFDEAEKFANDAFQYQRQYSIDISDNIEAEEFFISIKQERYNKAVRDGESTLSKKQNRQALEQFFMAEQLELDFNLKKSPKLPSLLKKAIKPVLLEDMTLAKQLITENKIEQAKELVYQVMLQVDKYDLKKDKEIATLLDDVQKKITTQECINAAEEINRLLDRAEKRIADLDFTHAEQQLLRVIEISNEMTLCRLDKRKAEMALSHYGNAITYAKQQEEIYYLLSRSNYKAVLDKYLASEDFYVRNDIAAFGLQHIAIYDFIRNGDNGMVIQGINYYCGINEGGTALNLLHILKNRNFSNRYVKQEQVKTAELLALSDFAKTPHQKPKILLSMHTENHNWFKFIRKAYLKKWKTLK